MCCVLVGTIVAGICITAMLFGDQLIKRVRLVVRWVFFSLILFNTSFAAFMYITFFKLLGLEANVWFQLFGFVCGYFFATKAILPIRKIQQDFLSDFNEEP